MVENKTTWSINKKKFALIISAIVISGLIVVYVITIPSRQYSHAKSLMNSKNYEEAIVAFTKLADYKDSNELLTENRYLYGKMFMENKEYLQAKEIFIDLHSYKDCKSNIQEIDYQLGLQYLNDKDYSKAIDSFNKNIDYKDSEQLVIESKYNYAKSLIEEKKFVTGIDLLTETKAYKDSSDILTETKYQEGLLLFQNGDLSMSKSYFSSIGKVYKDSQNYLDNISRLKALEGTWEDEYGWHQVIFSGNKVTEVFFPDSHDTKVYTWDLVYKNKTIMNTSGDIYYIKNNKLFVKTAYTVGESNLSVYSKKSDSAIIPEEKPSPRIGMTADEVRASNWGSPIDVNKTTTGYGVSEQWVYNNYKYIYLEDGIVTSIQE